MSPNIYHRLWLVDTEHRSDSMYLLHNSSSVAIYNSNLLFIIIPCFELLPSLSLPFWDDGSCLKPGALPNERLMQIKDGKGCSGQGTVMWEDE